MALHVIVGAGAPASPTAQLLADAGDRVRIVSRSGGGPEHPGVERIAADAGDAARIAELAEGASTIFNCLMPDYWRWPELFPPLNTALLTAAERSGANYVLLGNLYGYGPTDRPMTEDLPLSPTTIKGRVRAEMFRAARDAHHTGRVKVTEVRASDYVGAGARSIFTLIVAPKLLAGEPAVAPVDPDAAHSWTATGDVARTLVSVAHDERSWGRAWHVPSTELSMRELSARFAKLAGAPEPQLRWMTAAELHAAANADEFMRELPEMQYMFVRPFVLDTKLTRETFGLEATPIDVTLRETVDAMSAPAAA